MKDTMKDTKITEEAPFTCEECGAVNADQDGCEYVGGKLLCQSCMDYFLEHAPRVLECDAGVGVDETEPYYWISGYGWHPYDLPERFPYADVVYRKIDGWRGYYEPSVKDGFTLLEGWTTGYIDSTVGRKHLVNDFLEMIQKPELCPCNLWIYTARTSNIFSLGIGIAFKTTDAALLDEWLRDHLSCGIVSLQSALS